MKNLKNSFFKYVKLKRIVPGFSLKCLGAILLLPYLITFLFGNFKSQQAEVVWSPNVEEQLTGSHLCVINQTALGKEVIPLEIYVADKLGRSISADFEVETLKAQAVLIRTNLYVESEGKDEIIQNDEYYGKQPIPESIWQAAAQTAGVCITQEGKPITTSYFAVSNGATRNGNEVFVSGHNHMKSVLCSRDFLSEDYSSSIIYENSVFWDIWQKLPANTASLPDYELLSQYMNLDRELILYRDSVGYILFVESQGKIVTGEQFRRAFELPSACFHPEPQKNSIRITTKGSGHGLGMSQYGANELAKQDLDYIQILETYFHNIVVTKYE